MEQTGNSITAIFALGWFAFYIQNRHPCTGGSLMKPVDVGSSTGLDRLATRNEIMCAITLSADGITAPGCAYGRSLEMDSDFGGNACNFPEDELWITIARDMPDSKSN
jgi:hypothetical protein